MAKPPPNEDLFVGSTMTFGEHLEELRACLMRAVVGLVIGTLLGLLLANQVVQLIKSPLETALRAHYSELAESALTESYGGEVDADLIHFAQNQQLVFEEIFFERSELQRLFGLTSEGQPPEDDGKAHETMGKPEKTEKTDKPENTDKSEKSERSEGQAHEANEAHDAKQERLAQIFDEKLPTPHADLIKTRIWRSAQAKLTTLSPHESFMIWMKAGLVAGVVLSSPYVFYQIWLFVAAGLYPHERNYIYLYLPFSLGLFLGGAAIAFVFVFGPVLDFLFGFSRMLDIDPDLRISEVISFVLFLPLGFGVAFQLPLVMLFLHRIGIFSVEAYIEKWRISVLVIFVISMLLTPADPYSMTLLALPLIALYALGIGLCRWMPRGRNPFDEVYEP